MTAINRRRFLMISAAALLAGKPSLAEPLRQWRGRALGAEVIIALAHPKGEWLAARAFEEIERLERIFSLYREDSELTRLNRDGFLTLPSFDLLECLGVCSAVHRATVGAFDPTIQSLWSYLAAIHASGGEVEHEELERRRALVGFPLVQFNEAGVRYRKPQMAMTMNGVAQGYIADKVAELLRSEGLTDLLVNTGELRALGAAPGEDGRGWKITLQDGEAFLPDPVQLRNRALATSAPLGTAFDRDGQVSHILDPKTGLPVQTTRRIVSVSANSAALADALSTAGCLLSEYRLGIALSSFHDARLERLL